MFLPPFPFKLFYALVRGKLETCLPGNLINIVTHPIPQKKEKQNETGRWGRTFSVNIFILVVNEERKFPS